MNDHREYRRIAANVRVKFSGPRLEKAAQTYMEGIAENLGRHGIFVSTDRPCPVGSLVTVEFDVHPGDTPIPISAKALVRWSSRWKKPHGMGLLLVEFEHVGEDNFAQWLEELYELEERVSD